MTDISGFAGTILAPGSADYESARNTYGNPEALPAVIARPASIDDVAAAVRYAGAEGLALSVRSGGHSGFSSNDGGLVLDLAAFGDVEVLDGDRVRVGSGARWGDVATTLAQHGLALSSGDTVSVGVGGLTLSGGIGWMVRQYGLALDSLVEAEVVLASGEIVTASAESEPELFWALRGGGGNFGVVTRFTFQAHPLAGVVAGTITFDADDLRAALTGWRDVMREAPEQLNATFMAMPPFGPEMPASVMVMVCYGSDDEAAARAAIQPLLDLPTVTGSDIAPKAYAEVLEEAHPPEGPITVIVNNAFAKQTTDDLIEALVAAYRGMGGSVLMLRWLSGAFNRVPADATAFAHRDAELFVISAAFLTPDAPADAADTIARHWASLGDHVGGEYGNFTTETSPEAVERMYPPATLDRLRAIKTRVDPLNLFRQNHNIVPA